MAIPTDLSVTGFDNSTFSGEVGLTTVRQKPYDMAVAAARKARFTESRAAVQGGTITYIFRME
mgnify:FL=1